MINGHALNRLIETLEVNVATPREVAHAKTIDADCKLAELMAPIYARLNLPHEVDRRSLVVNGREILEKEMSDGTMRVFIEGCRVNMDYATAVRKQRGEW